MWQRKPFNFLPVKRSKRPLPGRKVTTSVWSWYFHHIFSCASCPLLLSRLAIPTFKMAHGYQYLKSFVVQQRCCHVKLVKVACTLENIKFSQAGNDWWLTALSKEKTQKLVGILMKSRNWVRYEFGFSHVTFIIRFYNDLNWLRCGVAEYSFIT